MPTMIEAPPRREKFLVLYGRGLGVYAKKKKFDMDYGFQPKFVGDVAKEVVTFMNRSSLLPFSFLDSEVQAMAPLIKTNYSPAYCWDVLEAVAGDAGADFFFDCMDPVSDDVTLNFFQRNSRTHNRQIIQTEILNRFEYDPQYAEDLITVEHIASSFIDTVPNDANFWASDSTLWSLTNCTRADFAAEGNAGQKFTASAGVASMTFECQPATQAEAYSVPEADYTDIVLRLFNYLTNADRSWHLEIWQWSPPGWALLWDALGGYHNLYNYILSDGAWYELRFKLPSQRPSDAVDGYHWLLAGAPLNRIDYITLTVTSATPLAGDPENAVAVSMLHFMRRMTKQAVSVASGYPTLERIDPEPTRLHEDDIQNFANQQLERFKTPYIRISPIQIEGDVSLIRPGYQLPLYFAKLGLNQSVRVQSITHRVRDHQYYTHLEFSQTLPQQPSFLEASKDKRKSSLSPVKAMVPWWGT